MTLNYKLLLNNYKSHPKFEVIITYFRCYLHYCVTMMMHIKEMASATNEIKHCSFSYGGFSFIPVVSLMNFKV